MYTNSTSISPFAIQVKTLLPPKGCPNGIRASGAWVAISMTSSGGDRLPVYTSEDKVTGLGNPSSPSLHRHLPRFASPTKFLQEIPCFGGPQSPPVIGRLAHCFLPDVLFFHFSPSIQQSKWKSMILTFHDREPSEPDKDNYHNFIYSIDTMVAFGMIDSPNRGKTISFQTEKHW